MNILNEIVLSFISYTIVLFMALKDDFNAIIATFGRMDYRFILLAILLYGIYIFLKAVVNYIWVHDKKFYLKRSLCSQYYYPIF